MSTATSIELNVEGTGPRVSTLSLGQPQAVDSTGSAVADRTVNQQLVSLASVKGDAVRDQQNDIIGELRLIRELLAVISSQLE